MTVGDQTTVAAAEGIIIPFLTWKEELNINTYKDEREQNLQQDTSVNFTNLYSQLQLYCTHNVYQCFAGSSI